MAHRTSDAPTLGGEPPFSSWLAVTPLAFALLPALAGLFFPNGSAFVTDLLLLSLAAVFMHWSIRFPWDWYRSAQAVGLRGVKKESKELRRHELLALTATFVLPAVAAGLLHLVRAQLSRTSTGLVSDYNLCIFVLAAEVRPLRQIARLISRRTLYLQRVASESHDPGDQQHLAALAMRVAELEARPPAHTDAEEMRKRYESRLQALERAVRRYEKRSTTLAMITEQRLNRLDARLQDALSLAAVAARSSNRVCDIILAPVRASWAACTWPLVTILTWYRRATLRKMKPPKAMC
ncbi:hypothetical protein K470DRAFT_260094 [Piedraia hortae CBS 480.64]|uniref:Uncharacterized protein n=1 Tax=Piedraia hortae CBS 480.64 TaxID=1314780 RepID=A0A6A7BUJ6_9PEZI|nr:hypothetical protein K470DRAFT_260094 [Piedraia hortae CBS 480.64]